MWWWMPSCRASRSRPPSSNCSPLTAWPKPASVKVCLALLAVVRVQAQRVVLGRPARVPQAPELPVARVLLQQVLLGLALPGQRLPVPLRVVHCPVLVASLLVLVLRALQGWR